MSSDYGVKCSKYVDYDKILKFNYENLKLNGNTKLDYINIKLEDVCYSNCEFKNMNFENSCFSNVIFINCKFINCRFIRGKINLRNFLEFNNCILDKIYINNCIFHLYI